MKKALAIISLISMCLIFSIGMVSCSDGGKTKKPTYDLPDKTLVELFENEKPIQNISYDRLEILEETTEEKIYYKLYVEDRGYKFVMSREDIYLNLANWGILKSN